VDEGVEAAEPLAYAPGELGVVVGRGAQQVHGIEGRLRAPGGEDLVVGGLEGGDGAVQQHHGGPVAGAGGGAQPGGGTRSGSSPSRMGRTA